MTTNLSMATPPIVEVYCWKPMLPGVSRVLACLYEKDVEFNLVEMYEGHRMPLDFLKLQVAHLHLRVRNWVSGPARAFLKEAPRTLLSHWFQRSHTINGSSL